MNIFYADSLKKLKNFAKQKEQLGILERNVSNRANIFFRKLMQKQFGVIGRVRKKSLLEDISDILKDEIPVEIQNHPFYKIWLIDMAKISSLFCEMQGTDTICFWLGSKRGCRRYHTDSVPLRLLVTYAGKGTEWLPDEAANRSAFSNGESNEKIVKNKSALQFLKPWDIAVFRGGPDGLLHRTPDAALNNPSILMRLDNLSFLEALKIVQ